MRQEPTPLRLITTQGPAPNTMLQLVRPVRRPHALPNITQHPPPVQSVRMLNAHRQPGRRYNALQCKEHQHSVLLHHTRPLRPVVAAAVIIN